MLLSTPHTPPLETLTLRGRVCLRRPTIIFPAFDALILVCDDVLLVYTVVLWASGPIFAQRSLHDLALPDLHLFQESPSESLTTS